MVSCRYRLESEEGGPEEVAADLTVDPQGIVLLPKGSPTLTISYSQLDGFVADDSSLTIRSGPLRLILNSLGRQFEETREEIRRAWQAFAREGLFRSSEPSWGPFPGRFSFSGKTSRGEAILFPDLLLLFLEEGGVTALPLRCWEDVSFLPEAYAVCLRTRTGDVLADQLARRSEEFRRVAEEALSQTRNSLASLLVKLIPDLPATTSRSLLEILWREMALPRGQMEEGIWNQLTQALQGEERAESVAFLAGHALPGQVWWGIAPPPPWEREGLPLTWFSARLAPTVLAVEVASAEEGYATYLFRLSTGEETCSAWIRQLHLTWPLVGFHRQLISQERKNRPGAEIASWEMTYRALPTLSQMRDNFLGKAIHDEPERWQTQIETIQKK